MSNFEYLNQAYKLDKLIDSDRLELEELGELIKCVSSVDYSAERVQKSKVVSDVMAEQMVKLIILQDKINDEINKYVSLKDEIRDNIMLVEDKNERLVLKCRFINFMKFSEIAEELNFTERQIYRIYKKALKNFKMSLNVSH